MENNKQDLQNGHKERYKSEKLKKAFDNGVEKEMNKHFKIKKAD